MENIIYIFGVALGIFLRVWVTLLAFWPTTLHTSKILAMTLVYMHNKDEMWALSSPAIYALSSEPVTPQLLTV